MSHWGKKVGNEINVNRSRTDSATYHRSGMAAFEATHEGCTTQNCRTGAVSWLRQGIGKATKMKGDG